MSGSRLQESIDAARSTSLQRWLLCALSITAPATATALITVGSGGFSGSTVWLLCLIVAFAAAAATYPDSSAGLAIIGFIAWQWIATVDDVTTARSLLVAICLFIFHTLLALMAVTPTTTIVPSAVLIRWIRRVGAVSLLTASVWTLVFVFERRDAPGSSLFTFMALGVLVVGVVGVVVGSAATPIRPRSRRHPGRTAKRRRFGVVSK